MEHHDAPSQVPRRAIRAQRPRGGTRPSPDGAGITLAPAYEECRVFVAMGLDFHNTCQRRLMKTVFPMSIATAPLGPNNELGNRSARPLPFPLLDLGGGEGEFTNHTQRVHYRISTIIDKPAFRAALETPGAIVIYAGHARYGRGPCFGSPEHDCERPISISSREWLDQRGFTGPVYRCPGMSEDWEDGSDPAEFGVFRMGYPFVPVALHEVLKHGYSTSPAVEADRVASPEVAPLRHPEIRPRDLVLKTRAEVVEAALRIRRRLREYTQDPANLERSWAGRAGDGLRLGCDDLLPDALRTYHDSEPSDLFSQLRVGRDDDRLWVQYDAIACESPPQTFYEPVLILRAGWRGTTASPCDLGGTTPRCRVFCHFGCSTYLHNHEVVTSRAFKGWGRQNDSGYTVYTTAPAMGSVESSFLYALFCSRTRRAFGPWREWVNDGVRATNRDLAGVGCRFRVRM